MTVMHSPADHPLLDSYEVGFMRSVVAFARDALAPSAAERDSAEKGEFDWAAVREGHELGLLRMGLPREMGGLGLSQVALALALEELGAADPGMAVVFGATGLFQTPLLICGDANLQERYLPVFLGAEPVLACNAVAEQLNGTDLVLPQNAPFAQDMTSAKRSGREFLLNGAKRYITNAPVATYATVMANIEGRDWYGRTSGV